MKYQYKNILIIILILVIVASIGCSIYSDIKNKKTENNQSTDEMTTENSRPIDICFYRSDKTSQNFYDISWLKLKLNGESVTGEFQNLPAETDSKVGKFEGTVGPVNQQTMSRTANVWWNSFAEGMNVKEELVIDFGDGSATVGFGEMIDRGDGVYVYKDKNSLYYQKSMSQIDCDSLDEKLFVEKYIRENISKIATNSPVLGGNWYVISVLANPSSHTAEVLYEDGHIQSKANIIYNYQSSTNSVEITKFEVIK